MQSVKAKILQYFALFSFITTIIIGVYVLYYVKNTIISEAEVAIERSAKDAAQIIAARNENQFIYLEGIAKANRFRFPQSVSKDQLLRLEEEVIGHAPFTRVGIADLEGNLYMLSQNNIDVQVIDIKNRNYYKEALKGNLGFMNPTETVNPEYAHQLVVAYAVPIYELGQIKGVLVATSHSFLLSTLLSDMGYGDMGYAYMLDSKGTTIAHPDPNHVTNKHNVFDLSQKNETYQELEKVVSVALKSESGTSQYRLLDTQNFVGYARVPQSDWTIFITANHDEVLQIMGPLLRAFYMVVFLIAGLNLLAYRRIRSEIHVSQTAFQNEADKLTELATFDALTGAYNRHTVDENLKDAMQNANHSNTPLAVVFIDIDRLKKVNDTLGHHVGDDYILTVIKAIKHYTRATDKLFRLGGDEFLLLLNHCQLDNASRILHLILESLEAQESLKPSFSYGIVQYDWLKHQTPDELIKEADTLMYAHKKNKTKH